MSIGFDTFFGEAVLKAKANCLLKYVLIDWNAMITYDDALWIIRLSG